MEKRPGDWYLIVPATLILLVFGTLGLAIDQAERGGPLGAWIIDVTSSQRWDRAASMATVIGLVVAIGALIYTRNSLGVAREQLKTQLDEIQREQQRIADSLSRKPELTLGISPNMAQRANILADEGLGPGSPIPALVTLMVLNSGKRTAHKLTVTVVIPAEGISGTGFESDPINRNALVCVFPTRDSLHPDQHGQYKLPMVFAVRRVLFEFQVTLGFDDSPLEQVSLWAGACDSPFDWYEAWMEMRVPDPPVPPPLPPRPPQRDPSEPRP